MSFSVHQAQNGSLSAWAESLRCYAGASTPRAVPWTSVRAACWVTLMFLQDYVHLSSFFSWILEERWVRLAPRTQRNLLWLLNFEVLLDQDVLISYFIHADKFFNCFFWLWLFALFLLFFPCSFSYTFIRNLYKHMLIRCFFDNSKLINNESILYTYIKNKFFTQWYCSNYGKGAWIGTNEWGTTFFFKVFYAFWYNVLVNIILLFKKIYYFQWYSYISKELFSFQSPLSLIICYSIVSSSMYEFIIFTYKRGLQILV